jgi:CRISPR-associated protein Csd1
VLHEVVNYARDKGLDAEPGFTPKTVKWAISVSAEGRFLGLIPLAADKKSKGRDFAKCPNLTQPEMKAGGVTKAHFLVDSLQVIANAVKKVDDKEIEKTRIKHQYFGELFADAAAEVPLLKGPALFLQSEDQVVALRAEMDAQKAKETDNATFFAGDHGYLVDRDEWHDWWRNRRRKIGGKGEKQEQAGDTATVRCFLSGELVTPAATHEKIKGLTDVGGIAMGDTLIGFKQEAFRSYGFEQSANAAMSVESAKAYVSGLNDLLQNQSRKLSQTKVAFWYKRPLAPDEDCFFFLHEGGGETQEVSALTRMRSLLIAIRAGERPNLAGNEYRGLELSSNGGRVVVRAWWEGSYEELLRNTVAWFDDLSIHRGSPGLSPAPKFYAVLNTAFRQPDDIVAPLEVSLWRSALQGGPIPEPFHAKVLLRTRALVTSGESITYVQAGLLKAFHRRRNGYMPEVQMDPNGPVPYQCGRLLAILANLQRAALGDVGAGVVERFYPAASSTPALVLGRLVLNAQNHLQKLRGDKKGLAFWFDSQVGNVLSRVPVDRLPKTLNLEEQSLFALGYYQQKANPGKSESEG